MRIIKMKAIKGQFMLFFAILGITIGLQAQKPEPPIPAELFLGNENLNFQLVVKKKFAPQSRFNFFTVATFTADYKNDLAVNRIIMPVQISYDLGKGFGVMAGGDYNSVVGFYPVFGPQYNYASKEFLAVTVASFIINKENDVKLFGLYEYKPSINNSWSGYSRLQFIYNHSFGDGEHNRSYLYLRAGLKKGPLAFGLAANLDRFGPMKRFEENYGPFIRWDF